MDAYIHRTDDHYYVLVMEGREVGATSKTRLERYAKSQGYTHIVYTDDRKPKMKVYHGL